VTHSAPQADCTPDVEQRLELLLAQLPLAPLKVLAPFVDGSDSTLHRHLNDLVDVGLVDSLPNQLQAEGRPGRLFYLASLGLTAARSDGVEPSALAQKLGLGGTHAGVAWLSKRLPGLLTAYELLALLAARGPGHAWLDGNRSGDVSRRRAAVPDVVRVLRDCQPVPAFVWTTPDGFLAREYVLVPDTGGLALPALRAALGHLAVYQAATQAQSTLAIATTTPRRAAGWTSLVETVCHAHGLPALDSEVTTWADLRREAARAAAALPIAFRKPPPRPVPRSAAQVDTPVSPRTTLPKSVCGVTALIWTRLGHLDRTCCIPTAKRTASAGLTDRAELLEIAPAGQLPRRMQAVAETGGCRA